MLIVQADRRKQLSTFLLFVLFIFIYLFVFLLSQQSIVNSRVTTVFDRCQAPGAGIVWVDSWVGGWSSTLLRLTLDQHHCIVSFHLIAFHFIWLRQFRSCEDEDEDESMKSMKLEGSRATYATYTIEEAQTQIKALVFADCSQVALVCGKVTMHYCSEPGCVPGSDMGDWETARL